MTKIKVPQQSTSETPVGDYEDEMMIDVVIEGDEFGVTSAIARIREIVGERVSPLPPLSDLPRIKLIKDLDYHHHYSYL